MATDQFIVESKPGAEPMSQRTPVATARGGGGWRIGLVLLLIVAGLGAGGYYMATTAKDRERSSAHEKAAGHGEGGRSNAALPRVEVVKPKRGGMEHITSQPGTVRAFDFAELYAKVSGYVKDNLKVDRGSRVKMGDLLIELYVPELVAAVEQARASLERAKASVVQAQARVTSARQIILAKQADLEKADSDLRAAAARREYRDKQFIRISQLVDRGAVEERLQGRGGGPSGAAPGGSRRQIRGRSRHGPRRRGRGPARAGRSRSEGGFC